MPAAANRGAISLVYIRSALCCGVFVGVFESVYSCIYPCVYVFESVCTCVSMCAFMCACVRKYTHATPRVLTQYLSLLPPPHPHRPSQTPSHILAPATLGVDNNSHVLQVR